MGYCSHGSPRGDWDALHQGWWENCCSQDGRGLGMQAAGVCAPSCSLLWGFGLRPIFSKRLKNNSVGCPNRWWQVWCTGVLPLSASFVGQPYPDSEVGGSLACSTHTPAPTIRKSVLPHSSSSVSYQEWDVPQRHSSNQQGCLYSHCVCLAFHRSQSYFLTQAQFRVLFLSVAETGYIASPFKWLFWTPPPRPFTQFNSFFLFSYHFSLNLFGEERGGPSKEI